MTNNVPPWPTLERLREGKLQGCRSLDLRGSGLTELPPEVLNLGDTLEVLDVSGNALTSLPRELAQLTRLHTLFASFNAFTDLPEVLGRLPLLDTLGFKGNRIRTVAPASLAPRLRWLILTDNEIGELPATLVDCAPMQKLMLAGNRLKRLPRGMARLQRLELMRLAANAFERAEDALTDELLALPRLSWLAFGGNPFNQGDEARTLEQDAPLAIPWTDLALQQLLGEGASGRIHAADWQRVDAGADGPMPVAVKLFKSSVTSDGLPSSEMTATVKAGHHGALVGCLGVLQGHPQGTHGLVLPRLSPEWKPLAAPPSMASCSRDVYADGLQLTRHHAAAILECARSAMEHLHDRGLVHGDLYAHNLLVNGEGRALLSDFGAASLLPGIGAGKVEALKALDRRALAILSSELELITSA